MIGYDVTELICNLLTLCSYVIHFGNYPVLPSSLSSFFDGIVKFLSTNNIKNMTVFSCFVLILIKNTKGFLCQWNGQMFICFFANIVSKFTLEISRFHLGFD